MKTTSSKTKTVLSCQNLVVGYKDTPIIKNINITFEAGQFITLLGPNGAGKTTLLRTLSRHLESLSGSIQIGDRPLAELRQAELARIMAVVLTDKVTPPLFNVFQFVALGRYPHTDFLGRLTEQDREVVSHSLSAVNAEDLTHREFASLSDGERQKVLVARALAQEPQILLLDEPTAHLDLKHRVEVMAILRNLCRRKGITVIASLHDVDIAAKVSDRVALIKNGAITDWGYPEEILTSETVADLYDFNSACFSHHLGSIELRGDGHLGKVFVVAGMGSGATIYRMLAKRGYAISTGVLQSNDLDCFVAESLGADCVSQAPSKNMSKESLTRALARLDKCDMVIDAGFDSEGPYQSNLTLLKKAATSGKRVFSLRKDKIDWAKGKNIAKVTAVDNSSQLFDAMEACQ
jgi:iron complex transport system ATP-binding protein